MKLHSRLLIGLLCWCLLSDICSHSITLVSHGDESDGQKQDSTISDLHQLANISQKDYPSLDQLKNQLIKQHNLLRQAHNIQPMLWDDYLASNIQRWANSCPGFVLMPAKDGTYQSLTTYYGCNDDQDCLSRVGAAWTFYDTPESRWNYDYSVCNGQWEDCATFTNMMGFRITSFACGWSHCPQYSMGDGRYIWCIYLNGDMQPHVPRSYLTKQQIYASLTSGAYPPTPSPYPPPTPPPYPPPTPAPYPPPTPAPYPPPTPAPYPPPPAPSPYPPPQVFPPLKDQLIYQHNVIRHFHGLSTNLEWNDAIADTLQRWANQCPGYQLYNMNLPENIAVFSSCSSPDDCRKTLGAAWTWYEYGEQGWDYKSNKCRDSTRCLCFTNMLARQARSFGCGWSSCPGQPYQASYIWCAYDQGDQYIQVNPRSGTYEELKAKLVSVW